MTTASEFHESIIGEFFPSRVRGLDELRNYRRLSALRARSFPVQPGEPRSGREHDHELDREEHGEDSERWHHQSAEDPRREVLPTGGAPRTIAPRPTFNATPVTTSENPPPGPHRSAKIITATAKAAGIAFVFGTMFLRRPRNLADPLIDVGLFRRAAFTASLAINVLNFFIGFGALLGGVRHALAEAGVSSDDYMLNAWAWPVQSSVRTLAAKPTGLAPCPVAVAVLW